jgi:hypothetical protein
MTNAHGRNPVGNIALHPSQGSTDDIYLLRS